MKTALITGSSSGIGAAIAVKLATEGYEILMNGRRNKLSGKLLRQMEQTTAPYTYYPFDVSRQGAVNRAGMLIRKNHQSIEALILNAGITANSRFLDMSNDEWDRVIKTNIYGTYYALKTFLPLMIEHGYGRVIIISSIIGKTGGYGQTNYATAKAGLLGLTKSLAKELGQYKVTVNAICPGIIDTSILDPVPTKYISRIVEQLPLARMGTPQEVADLVAFLVSEKSNYINGAILDIHGGWI